MLAGTHTKKFNTVSIHHGWMQKHGFFCFRPEILLLRKIWSERQNSHFQPKFGASTNSSMQKSRWCSLFSVFDQTYPFWVNLIQKINSLSWSLLDYCNLSMQNSVVMFTFSVFIQKYLMWKICRIHWCCLSFFVLTRHTFFGKFGRKKSKLFF